MDSKTLTEQKYGSIVNLISERYNTKEGIEKLAAVFKEKKCVHLSRIFPQPIFDALKKEAETLIGLSVHKDFVMKGYETPRLMNVVNAPQIIKHSQLLWTLYSNHHLFNVIQMIVGTPMFPSKHPVAFMALNYLKGMHSTQGWHLDDGSYAVIYAFKVPGLDDGGVLEYIPDWIELCRELNVEPDTKVDATVEEARKRNLVRSTILEEGDCYILKSDTSLHRVSEMRNEDSGRLVLAVGYENRQDTTYTHTGTDLYESA